MELTARDIMVHDYRTIEPEALVRDAVRIIYEGRVRDTGYKPFGIMVMDDMGRLVGMISMFDILFHLRPPFMNYELQSFTISQEELAPYVEQFQDLTVAQVMSSPVVAVSPDDNLLMIVDVMVKKRARRLPVLAEGRILGVVYISDVFFHLCRTWLRPG